MSEVACARCGKLKPPVLLFDGLCNYCRSMQAVDDRNTDLVLLAETPVPSLTAPQARAPRTRPQSQFLVDRKAAAVAAAAAAAAVTAAAPPAADPPVPTEVILQELARRELARRRFLPFVQRFNPDYEAGWVHIEIAAKLEQFVQDVKDQKSPRLMIWMPPRHGKSQLTSKSLPAWVLGQYPQWEFMLCSYSGSLANRFSREVRGIMRSPEYQTVFDTRLDPDTQSVELWQTTRGGGLQAAGVGGPITGSGAHIMLIDDPVKNREEAESAQMRQVTKDWYTSTAYTRLAPGGGILVIQTRWHDDDLSGWLVREMHESDGEPWEIITYPALALKDEPRRAKDEPLHPQRYDGVALARIRKAIGERDWWALYQQQPVADDGSYFTRDMFQFYRPEELELVRDQLVYYNAWDLAVGQGQSNDWSVGATAGLDRDENLWITDLKRGRWDGLALVEHIIDQHVDWKAQMTGLEHGQIHMTLQPFLDRRIAERRVWSMYYESLKTGRRDKVARARSIQGMFRLGKVRLPHPSTTPWVNDFINELLRFPAGVNDDQVDAIAWLGLMITEMSPSVPLAPRKPKSWKDQLDKLAAADGNHRSAMSA